MTKKTFHHQQQQNTIKLKRIIFYYVGKGGKYCELAEGQATATQINNICGHHDAVFQGRSTKGGDNSHLAIILSLRRLSKQLA